MVFLEIPNVPKGMVFAEKVTYITLVELGLYIHNYSVNNELKSMPNLTLAFWLYVAFFQYLAHIDYTLCMI